MKRGALGLCLLAAACGGDSVCGEDGSRFDADSGARYCVYEAAIVVEGGFECPAGFPIFIDAGPFGICSPDVDEEEDLPPELCRRFRLTCADDDADAGTDAGDPCGDDDGDGLSNASEVEADVDGDGVPGNGDTDSDGDGLLDGEEAGPETGMCQFGRRCNDFGTFLHLDPDSDDDGVSDADEVAAGTDVCDPDSNSDGCPDGITCLPTDTVWMLTCEAFDEFRTNVEVTAPRDATWAQMVLEEPAGITPSGALAARPDMMNAAPGTMPGIDRYDDVTSGSTLRFIVTSVSGSITTTTNPTFVPWRLVDDADETMAEGRVILVGTMGCEVIPI